MDAIAKKPRKPRKPAIVGNTIGERIRSARQSAGLAQAPLAGRCGLSQCYICLLEGGKKQASVRTLQKIASALGTTVGRLLGEG